MKLHFYVGDVDREHKEVLELCKTWWKETPLYRQFGIKYNPDPNFFTSDGIKGNIIGILCRDLDNNNKLVGCYVGLFQSILYNPDFKYVTEVAFGVHKEYRGTRCAYLLIKSVDEIMAALNIKHWLLSAIDRPEYKHFHKMLDKMGYKSMETIYGKKR